jgi:DNA-binding NarL/FixJ family response regulator
VGAVQSERVVVADDHPPTRASVCQALVSGGFIVGGEASDAACAVALVEQSPPDVALLDVRMPGGGIAAAAHILAEHPEVAVVMLTVSEDDEDLFAALRVGALGYVLKGGDLAMLPGMLRQVLRGEAVLERAMLTKLFQQFQSRERRRLFRTAPRLQLTAREQEILSLLEGGSSTAEIAAHLFIAKVTVRSHIASICRKLRVTDRASAIREMQLELRSKSGDASGPDGCGVIE